EDSGPRSWPPGRNPPQHASRDRVASRASSTCCSSRPASCRGARAPVRPAVRVSQGKDRVVSSFKAAPDAKQMTERERAEEKVRGIVEDLDRPTLALLYKTLHDALGFRIET